jgi:hypothetical protein
MRLRRAAAPGRAADWRSLVALLVGLALATAAAAHEAAGDAAAKARFAVTLARFVRWPAADGAAAMRLCVLQHSPAVAEAFAAHEGSLVAGRRLSIVLQAAPAADACDLLFVDGSANLPAQAAIEVARSAPVLTLGAVDGFAARGGMIEVVNVNDALRFDVNLAALRAAGLALNSQALKLARQVFE